MQNCSGGQHEYRTAVAVGCRRGHGADKKGSTHQTAWLRFTLTKWRFDRHPLRRGALLHNTVIVVEHRLEVIAQADWIIDMGPGAGDRGGSVVFTGTPRQLLDCRESETTRFLREAVEPAVSAV